MRRASDDTVYNTTMPGVNWNLVFGDSNISVDIGRTVHNSFELHTGNGERERERRLLVFGIYNM